MYLSCFGKSHPVKTGNKNLRHGQAGFAIVQSIIMMVVSVVVVGAVVVALWGTFTGTNTDIQALTQTDAGTTVMQSLWPIILIVGGVLVGAGVVLYILRKFSILN